VALAAPYYPPYVNVLTALGMTPVILEAGPETRYQPTIAMLEQLDPLPDGLILASPNNPAGTMLSPAELAALAEWCHGHGVRLISDEIYHGLHYGQDLATATQFSSSAIVVNSFSKYFGLTGWRIGWMVLPEDLVRPVQSLAQNMFISPPHIAQIAAEAALDCGAELDARVAAFRRTRQQLLRDLPGCGFPRFAPAEGAFYLYADISHRANCSIEFCDRLMQEAGIVATPGVDFDRARGHQNIRFSYCGDVSDVEEAVSRLRAFA
jgi:aspartate/methionine/tyrosine aminotransferase